MRTKDGKHHSHHPAAHHISLSGAEPAAPPLNELETLMSPGRLDFAEEAPGWEAAWIDLGGEG